MTRQALYLLAGASVPEAARQDAVERVEAGERIERTIAEFRAKQKGEIDSAVEPRIRLVKFPS